MKNHEKINTNLQLEKNAKKIDFGKVLGSIREGLGTVWDFFWAPRGLFWSLLGASGSFFERSKSNFLQERVQDELQGAFRIDFGTVWGGFGEEFGEDLGPFRQAVDRFWTCLKRFGPAGAESPLGPPRWSALRHNARGSSPRRGKSRTLNEQTSFFPA